MAFDLNSAVFIDDEEENSAPLAGEDVRRTKGGLSQNLPPLPDAEPSFYNFQENSAEQTKSSEENRFQNLKNVSAQVRPYKAPNPVQKFANALKWVNEASRAAWNEGAELPRIADLEMKDMLGTIQQAEKRELENIDNKKPYDYKLAEKSPLPIAFFQEKDFIKRGYIETVKMLPVMWETVKRGGIGGIAGAGIGGAITRTPQGAYMGAVWGSRITGGLAAAELEAGLARHELKQENEKIKKEGGEPLSNVQLNFLSCAAGIANGTLEMTGLNSVLKTQPGGHIMTDIVKGKAAKELIRDKAVREKLKEIFKDYGESLIVEPGTEMLQETNNVIAQYYADKWGKISDETLPDHLKNEAPRILEAGADTFSAMMFLGGFGSTAKTASILIKKGMDKKAAEKAASNMTQAQKEALISENMDTLMEIAKEAPDVQEYDKRQALKENFASEMRKGVKIEGINDDVINDTAEIAAHAVSNLANNLGMDTDKVNELFKFQVKTLSDAEAVKQVKADNKQVLKGQIEKTETINNQQFQSIETAGAENQPQKNIYTADTAAPYENFIKRHNTAELTETAPEYWEGQTIEEAKEFLGFGDKKSVKIKSPVEEIIINENHLKHLIEENNSYRKKYLNRALKTMQKPNIIIKQGDYHNYIKLFGSENSIKPHLQIVKVKEDGSFYVTNFKPNRRQFKQILQGQVIYDLSKNTDVGLNPPADNIISNSKNNLNPFEANFTKHEESGNNKNIYFQSSIKQPYEYDYITNQITGGKINIEMNNDIKVKTIEPQIISSELPFKISKKASDNKKSLFIALNLEQSKNIINKNTNEKVILNKGTIEKSLSNKSVYDLDYNDFCLILFNTAALFETSQKILSHKDTKKNTDLTINRYANTAEINGKNYLLEFVTKNSGEMQLYSINTLDNKKTVSANVSTEVSTPNTVIYTNSISDIQRIFKSKLVQKYNNDYKNSQREQREQKLQQDNNILFQSAYHGTPHRFDEFSLDKIGTGEGAQAHGWGLYFAGDKQVSEGYRRTLSGVDAYEADIELGILPEPKSILKYDDINIAKFLSENYKKLYELYTENGVDIDTINSDFVAIAEYCIGEGKKGALEYLKDIRNSFKELEGNGFGKAEKSDYDINDLQIEFVKNIDISKLKIETEEIEINQGQLFEVDIPENDVLLDEQELLSEQNENVQKLIKNVIEKEELSFEGFDPTGKDLYKALSKKYGSDKTASEILNKVYGIKGITYDGYQDGRCYVIFDDKAVNVLKTYYQSLDENYNEVSTEEGIKNSRGFTYSLAEKNMIVLLDGKADKSTLLHEFSHIYLNVLTELARENAKAKRLLLDINKQLRYDGREYTRAQLEKFAEMFEAYVKTGKAPSYGLKKAFEHFRKWLGDIYNGISSSGKYTITKEWQNIFDELLGDISVDKRFDKSKELIQKAKDYANLKIFENSKDEIVQQNYLTDKQIKYRDTAYEIIFYALSHSKNEKTRNYVKSIPQLRMILGAEGKKKQGAGLAKQQDRIRDLLAQTDDAFSANDGFLPAWGEFFTDPGVSRDNQYPGADTMLAMRAYNVIMNKDYLKNENNLEELSEADIQAAQYELDYIIEEYRKGKPGDRTIAMAAFFNWIDSQHPYIQEELTKQWEFQTNEIDRRANLDKWQLAKEDLKLEAARLKMQGDFHLQFMEYVRIILKRLDFLSESDKAKLFNLMKDYDTMRDIEKHIDEVMDFAKTLYGVSERRHLAENIIREVKQTIHEWQNGIKKTKYTFPANKLFTRLREIERMNKEQIEKLYSQIIDKPIDYEQYENPEYYEKNNASFYEQLEEDFIKFKYNGSYYNSAEFLIDLLERIQTAKFEAKLARDEMDFNRRVEQIKAIDELAKASDVRRTQMNEGSKTFQRLKKVFAKIHVSGANLNGYLELMFGKAARDKYSLDYLYAQKDAAVGADRRYFLDKACKIFGFKGIAAKTLLFNKFINMNKAGEFEIRERYTPDKVKGVFREWTQDRESGKTYTVKETPLRDTGEIHNEWNDEPLKLSKWQVIYYYIQSKNPVSYKMLTDMGDETRPAMGQFDKFEFDALLNQLTPEEKLLGDLMQLCAEKYFDKLNAYHIKKYHSELGKVPGYFPRRSKTQEVKILDMFNDYVQFSGSGSFQKLRTAGPGVRIEPANALEVLFSHIEKANTVIIMGEKLDLMNRIFKDSDLNNKLAKVWGDSIQKDFLNEVTAHLFQGQNISLSLSERFQDRIMSNLTKVQIMGKLIMTPKQFLSFMNYGKGDEYVSAKEWHIEFLKQTFKPQEWKKNIDYMMNIPYLKDRFSRGGSTDALKRELEHACFAKINLIDEFWTLPVSIGDIGAIIAGGKPYIDALIKKGYKEDEAIKIFIETTVNDQQSSIPSTLSAAQRNAAKSPMARLFYSFQNTPWQYWRHCTTAIMRVLLEHDKKAVLNALNRLFFYAYLFPMLFNMVSSGSVLRYAQTGDSEDLLKDLNPFYVIPGIINHIPLIGNILQAVMSAIKGEQLRTGVTYIDNAKRDLYKLLNHWEKDEVTIQDLYNAAVSVQEPVFGIPIRPVVNAGSGLYNIYEGDYLKGGLKAMGYSDYRAEYMTGEDE